MEDNKFKPADKKEGAIFNMAIASLMRLDAMLNELKLISVGLTPDGRGKFMDAETQLVSKYKLVKQFMIQSMPLLNSKENKQDIKESFDSIKFQTTNARVSQYKNEVRQVITNTFVVDNQLDDLVLLIMEYLQEEKYFMPSPKDARYGWKQ